MVDNLLRHLGSGSAAVIAGGPRMGKTTFLQQIAAAVDGVVQPIPIDLATTSQRVLVQWISTAGDPAAHLPSLLLIDGCERLLPDPGPFIHEIDQAARHFGERLAGNQLASSVWAGNARWGEWAMANRSTFTGPVRYYPLIVLPPKEARLFLKRRWPADVPSSELEWVMELSGGHPYLLAQMVGGPKRDFDPFFAELWKEADSAAERHIIAQLVEAKSWVLLQDLHDETGGAALKPVLDRLAVTGLINRTLIDGAAAAALVSPLLADWIRRTRQS